MKRFKRWLVNQIIADVTSGDLVNGSEYEIQTEISFTAFVMGLVFGLVICGLASVATMIL